MDKAGVPTLYILCGKIAAGKSTLARRLAARPATLLVSEDHWTSSLFSGELKTIEDYGRCSARLRAAMHRTLSISCGKAFRLCWIFRQTPSAIATGCAR